MFQDVMPIRIPGSDPSKNVLDILGREVRRLDDLYKEQKEWVREIADGLRRESKTEAARIDSNRNYDRLEVTTATERQQIAVDTLARGVEHTRQTLAEQTESKWKELDIRIRALENLQSTSGGKGQGLNSAWLILIALVSLVGGLLIIGPKLFGH